MPNVVKPSVVMAKVVGPSGCEGASDVHENFFSFFCRKKNVLGQMMRYIIAHFTATKGCRFQDFYAAGRRVDTH
jgi:hypothetical protein